MQNHHGYFVALFDILGFEKKLETFGLDKMRAAYEALIIKVVRQNNSMARLHGEMRFCESPYWFDTGDIFIFHIVQGAYASDSILLWANRTWPEAREMSTKELKELSSDAAGGWISRPIPCDNFLDVCNELICHSLEIGLPLRGAVSLGQAVFDDEKKIYLGQPIVDVARMEKGQRIIGMSLCKPFTEQIIPRRYLLQFDAHLKSPNVKEWGGSVIDWPRHWRKTRKSDVRKAVESLNVSAAHGAYYDNTLRLIDVSATFAGQFESKTDVALRAQYPEFSYANQELALKAIVTKETPA